MLSGACIYLYHSCRNASTPIVINCPKYHNIRRPASLLSPVLRLLCRRIHIPVSPSPLSPLSHIYTAAIARRPSPPPTLSAIPIIPHLYRGSVVILLYLCCGPHYIVFNRPESFAAVVCLRSSCVSAVSYDAPISIITKYLPQHRPRLTHHILCHCKCYPAISAAAIFAPVFIVVVSLGPRLSASSPSNKSTCPGYGHYGVLDTAGVGLVQTGKDGRAGQGGRERDGGSRWTNGEGWNGRELGRPERQGRRHKKTKIPTNDLR